MKEIKTKINVAIICEECAYLFNTKDIKEFLPEYKCTNCDHKFNEHINKIIHITKGIEDHERN